MTASVPSGSTTTVLIGVQITEAAGVQDVVEGQGVSRRHKPITEVEARYLTERIRIGLAQVWQLLESAYVDRAWAALGYPSWDDYCAREFGETRIPIPKEERETVVRSLREAGLSYRAIESATDMSSRTIRRSADSTGANAPVDQPVVGVNGKTYQPTSPRPVPADVSADDVIDAEIVADDVDDLIECDTCGGSHPPEVAVCPYLVIAAEGSGDTGQVYGRSNSVESGDPNQGADDGLAGSYDIGGDDVSDESLAVLTRLGEAVQRFTDFRDELDGLDSLAEDASAALDYLCANNEIAFPSAGMEMMIRESVAGIRQQMAQRLSEALILWEGIGARIEEFAW
ncbi:hypothetical protein ABIB25_000924 [Nakamurella sp. UYEF19]|uniref:hypothetical protein n=1 Tax=Nakamurella sp. UYEF19 TaxID=1756392 RepID=UPI0033909529